MNVTSRETWNKFFEHFCCDVVTIPEEKNMSFLRSISYTVESLEVEGEFLRIALNYLYQTHNCPPSLAEFLSRETFELWKSDSTKANCVDLPDLQKMMEKSVRDLCCRWNCRLPGFTPAQQLYLPVSVCAMKNTRRCMEDRHTVIQDINALFQLEDSTRRSFYAIFDGHGGPEAAIFSASQLIMNLMQDKELLSNVEAALRRACSLTDHQFLSKAQSQKFQCGTTVVALFICGDICYATWIGDSQIFLVNDGSVVTLMEPHTPNREDERQRIESLGGDVTDGVDGVMRVNCSVSVSRAIGDANLKPYLSSMSEVIMFTLSGLEDYIILGSDGIWDVISAGEVPLLVHSFLAKNPDQHSSVAKHLVDHANSCGSTDNITCIVVFLRLNITACCPGGLHMIEDRDDIFTNNAES